MCMLRTKHIHPALLLRRSNTCLSAAEALRHLPAPIAVIRSKSGCAPIACLTSHLLLCVQALWAARQ